MRGQQHPLSGVRSVGDSAAGPTLCAAFRTGVAGSPRLPLLASLSVAGTVSLGLWCVIALAAWLLVT